MARSDELWQIGGEGFELAVDLRHRPLYITRWRGRVRVEDVAAMHDLFLELAEGAESRETRIAYVNDIRGLQRSTGDVRRRLTEIAGELQRSAHGRVSVGSWNILASAVFRRVLAMVRWMTGNEGEDHFVADLAAGIVGARIALERVGEQVDIDPSSYSFPDGL